MELVDSTYIPRFINVCLPWAILWLITVMSGVVVSARLKPMLWTDIISSQWQINCRWSSTCSFFLLFFIYGMSYCFLIVSLYWDLWGGRFRAADSSHTTGVIPCNFQYDNWFQSVKNLTRLVKNWMCRVWWSSLHTATYMILLPAFKFFYSIEDFGSMGQLRAWSNYFRFFW